MSTLAQRPQDVIFNFTAPNGVESACRLLINNSIVVASDVDEGSSVTNAAEEIATLVVSQFKISPDRLVWIEHYPGDSEQDETLDLVQFNWGGGKFSEPRWTRITRAAAEALFGAPIRAGGIVDKDAM